jgi:hypothetical protein
VIFGPIRQEFRCRLVGWTPSIALPSRCFLFCFLLLISFVHGSAQEKKACGELFDREALRRVRTFCVDTSYLQEGEASDIKKFVARENQPGQLLRRLTWEFTDQCAAADAVIRVYFAQSVHLTQEPGDELHGGVGSFSLPVPVIQVVLLIYDRASVRLLYRTEDNDLETKRMIFLKGPFSRLVKDVEKLGH